MPSTRQKAVPSREKPSNDQPPSKKRKTKPEPVSEPDPEPEIVGGSNGDYRITGKEQILSPRTFTVPTDNNKVIPVQERVAGHTEPAFYNPALIFTHGAGGGLENPATKHFADGYGTLGRILCFQGTMNLQSRVKNFATMLDEMEVRDIAVGGRSMGARAAVLVAQDFDHVKKLVLVSYPLKGQKGDIRDQILFDLPEDKEVLFVVGSEDGMCSLKELEKVRKKMKAKTSLVVVEGADHSMSVKLTRKGLSKEEKERVVETVRKTSGRVAAEWVKDSGAVKDGRKIDWVDLDWGDGGEEREEGKEEESMQKSEDHEHVQEGDNVEKPDVDEEKDKTHVPKRTRRKKT